VLCCVVTVLSLQPSTVIMLMASKVVFIFNIVFSDISVVMDKAA